MATMMSPGILSPTGLPDYMNSRRLNTVSEIDVSPTGDAGQSADGSHIPPMSAGILQPATPLLEPAPADQPQQHGGPGIPVTRLASMPASLAARRQSTIAELSRIKLKLPGSNSASALNSSQLRHYREVISELRDLQEAMEAGGCVHWLLIISAALMDVETLATVFCDAGKDEKAQQDGLMDKWRDMLENTGARGYSELASVVAAEVSRRRE